MTRAAQHTPLSQNTKKDTFLKYIILSWLSLQLRATLRRQHDKMPFSPRGADSTDGRDAVLSVPSEVILPDTPPTTAERQVVLADSLVPPKRKVLRDLSIVR